MATISGGVDSGLWINLLSCSSPAVQGKRSPLKREKFIPHQSSPAGRQKPNHHLAVRENSPSLPAKDLSLRSTRLKLFSTPAHLDSTVPKSFGGTSGEGSAVGRDNVLHEDFSSDVEVAVLGDKLKSAEQTLLARDSELSEMSAQNRQLSSQVQLLWKNLNGSWSPGNGFSGLTPPSKDLTSPMQNGYYLEVQSLRDALDKVTKEKQGLEVLCSHFKTYMSTVQEVGCKVGVSPGSSAGNSPGPTSAESLSREVKLLKFKLEQVHKDKSAELDDSLEHCGLLQEEKSVLMREKDLLATSLRQEGVYTQHLEAEVGQLEGQVGQLQTEVASGRDRARLERDQAARRSQDHQLLLGEYRLLQGQLEGQTASSKEIVEALKTRLDSVQQDFARADDVATATAQELGVAREEVQRLRCELSRYQEDRATAERERVGLEAGLASYRAECEELRRSLISAPPPRQGAGLARQPGDDCDDGSAELPGYSGAESDVNPFGEDSCNTEVLLLQQKISELELSLAILEKKGRERERASGASLRERELEVEGLRRELAGLREQLLPQGSPGGGGAGAEGGGALRQVVTLLSLELRAARQQLLEAQGASTSLAEQLAEKDRLIEGLSRDRSAGRGGGLADRTAGENGLRNQNSEVQELEETRRELEETRRELEETRRELEETRRELEETRRELEETRKELEESRGEVVSLRGLLAGQSRSLQALGRQQEVRTGELDRARASVTVATTSTAALCAARSRQLEQKEQSVEDLTTEVRALRARHGALNEELLRAGLAQEDRAGLLPRLLQLEQDYRNLEQERNQLKSALQHSTASLQAQEGKTLNQCARCGRAPPTTTRATQVDTNKRHFNYLRTKLGYTLTELRLYRKQKAQMDVYLSEMNAEVDWTKGEYQKCLQLISGALYTQH